MSSLIFVVISVRDSSLDSSQPDPWHDEVMWITTDESRYNEYLSDLQADAKEDPTLKLHTYKLHTMFIDCGWFQGMES